jgi:DNA-binding NarL/FixJ family response regulator
MIRVLLADDQDLVRAGLRMILTSEADLDLVAEAADGESAVAQARATQPDVILMDVRMPQLDGIEATRRVMGMDRPPAVIVLTTFDLDEYVYRALRAGAQAFLLKDTPEQQLLAAIRVVAAGGSLFAPSVTRRLIERFTDTAPTPDPGRLQSLSPRELEVLQLVARGLSNSEIADRLLISEHTTKTHVASVLAKLNLRNRVQAVVLAYESGLVRVGG